MARAVNVSATGALFSVDGPLHQGQHVSFTLLEQRVDAHVVRAQVGRAAVRFLRPLTRRELDALRLGSGSDDPPEHVSADRTTALRMMARSIRRAQRLAARAQAAKP